MRHYPLLSTLRWPRIRRGHVRIRVRKSRDRSRLWRPRKFLAEPTIYLLYRARLAPRARKFPKNPHWVCGHETP